MYLPELPLSTGLLLTMRVTTCFPVTFIGRLATTYGPQLQRFLSNRDKLRKSIMRENLLEFGHFFKGIWGEGILELWTSNASETKIYPRLFKNKRLNNLNLIIIMSSIVL